MLAGIFTESKQRHLFLHHNYYYCKIKATFSSLFPNLNHTVAAACTRYTLKVSRATGCLYFCHTEAPSYSWRDVSSLQLTISHPGLRLWSCTTKVSGSFALQFNITTVVRLYPFSTSFCWDFFLWRHTTILHLNLQLPFVKGFQTLSQVFWPRQPGKVQLGGRRLAPSSVFLPPFHLYSIFLYSRSLFTEGLV